MIDQITAKYGNQSLFIVTPPMRYCFPYYDINTLTDL